MRKWLKKMILESQIEKIELEDDQDDQSEEDDSGMFLEMTIADYVKIIKPFYGDFGKWRAFKVEIEEGILFNKEVSKLLKRSLIKSVLDKKPLNIWNYALADGKNLIQCWNKVKEEYEDPIKINFYLTEKVAAMKPIRNEEDKTGLKRILDQVQEFKAAVKFLGDTHAVRAEAMIGTIADKFWLKESDHMSL